MNISLHVCFINVFLCLPFSLFPRTLPTSTLPDISPGLEMCPDHGSLLLCIMLGRLNYFHYIFHHLLNGYFLSRTNC